MKETVSKDNVFSPLSVFKYSFQFVCSKLYMDLIISSHIFLEPLDKEGILWQTELNKSEYW
jgi:hypothetical protein